MHSKDKLAAALEENGLTGMAEKARAGYYHDYLSPLAMPCIQLAGDLMSIGTPEALALRARHLNGEFDATPDEGKAWIESPDGQETLSHLPPAMRKLITGEK